MKIGKYIVRFTHRNPNGPIESSSAVQQQLPHGGTICTINTADDSDTLGTGVARLHHNDRFCYEKGRMASLSKAMKDANILKEERAAMWEDYRTKGGVQRW